MTRGQRRGFIEEEELCIELPPYLAMTPIEFKTTADPGPADMSALTQRAIVAMKFPTPVSEYGPARGYCDELSEGIHAIL